MTIIEAIKATDAKFPYVARDAWRSKFGGVYAYIEPTDIEFKCIIHFTNGEKPYRNNWAPFRADLLATDWMPADWHGKTNSPTGGQ